MKKTLLIFMVAVFCTSLIAQQTQRINPDVFKPSYFSETMPLVGSKVSEVVELSPELRHSPLFTDNLLYNTIGQTHYNTPSNANARNTISFRSNSFDVAAVWTMSSVNSTTRGTGINYYDVNSNEWEANPSVTERIETKRTGWGTHAFTENGEIVVAHDAETGIVVNTRDNWGDGTWNQSIILGPEYQLKDINGNWAPTTKLNWPTMATNGNTVHLLCVTDAWTNTTTGGVSYLEDQFPDTDNLHHGGYKGFNSYPMYYRSLDAGKTWEGPVDFGQSGLGLLTNYQTFKFGGDEYVITVKGDHVVIIFHSLLGFVVYLESLDNGNTWTKKTVYDRGEVFLGTYSPEVPPLLVPTCSAIAIDDNEQVHVVFSTHAIHKNEDAQVSVGIGFYNNIGAGMVYWNDSMEPLNWEELRGWANPDSGNLDSLNWESHPGYIPVPSVVGWDEYYHWSFAPSYDKGQFHHNGWTPYVRLIAKDDRVYVAFQSPLDYPFNFTSPDQLCRGIFVTVSNDNGASWDVQKNTSWISYYPDLQWADWSEYEVIEIDEFTTIDQLKNALGKINMEFVSEQGFPTMSFNTKGDMVIIQWLYHHLKPFPNDNTVFETNPMFVYTFVQNLKNLPAYKNIGEVYKGLWNNDEPEINFPDLGCERPVKVNFQTCTSEDETEFYGAMIHWQKPEYINVPLQKYHIYRDGVKIGEAPFSNALPGYYFDGGLEEGTYTYQVSAVYEGGCESTLTRAKTYTLGDNPVYLEGCNNAVLNIPAPTFKLYPNPTNGNVTVKIDAISPYSLTVTNIMGQVITSLNGNSDMVNLNVSNYAPGIYIVNIRTDNATISQKLVVK